MAEIAYDGEDYFNAFLAQTGLGARAQRKGRPAMTPRAAVMELAHRNPESKAQVQAVLAGLDQNAGLALQPETLRLLDAFRRFAIHEMRTNEIRQQQLNQQKWATAAAASTAAAPVAGAAQPVAGPAPAASPF